MFGSQKIKSKMAKIEKAVREHADFFERARNASICLGCVAFLVGIVFSDAGPALDPWYVDTSLLFIAIAAALATFFHQFLRECPFGLHEWEGCRCVRCGRHRNAEHSWEGCVCSECGATRDEGHDFQPAGTREEEEEVEVWLGGHFSYFDNTTIYQMYECSRCGAEREEAIGEYQRY